MLLAIPSAGPSLIHSLVQQLEPYKVPLTTLPSLTELLNGKVGLKHIRPVAVEDLLPRKQISLSQVGARVLIEGRRVLVTGAGGSIGSGSVVRLRRSVRRAWSFTNDTRTVSTPSRTISRTVTAACRFTRSSET